MPPSQLIAESSKDSLDNCMNHPYGGGSRPKFMTLAYDLVAGGTISEPN
ncbi:hypothetical protein FOTG_16747 [Fusarium oxysporum f. sp. vasinfectum 25433]|uniref:Uncharacterized protein n=1 Tax=Fusarium oxysporum f. sp. vasinfectum 25433 TaxID=1089449 RepID=X0KMP9_FUSOX|nr:hypothetical protein FOTG_16747 [Fusarium oxysporum f. sp. vasinfectum 25433]